MAQTGYTPILIYSSSTTTNAPAAGSLTNSTLGSELAINITDGKLFYKDNTNAVQVIAWKVTPTTAGGTGLTSYSQGDLLYYNTGTTLTALAKNTTATRYLSNTGTNNNPAWAQVDLTNGVTGDLPFSNLAQGSALSVLGVTGNATADVASIAAGTDHQVLRRSGTSLAFGAIALNQSAAVTGTLPVGNGGTGTATAFTAGSVVFAGASGVYSQSNAQFFWDNTNSRLGLGTTAPFTKLHAATGADGSSIPTKYSYSDAIAVFSTGDSVSADGYFKIQSGLYNAASTTNLDLITSAKDNNKDAGWRLVSGCGAGAGSDNGYLAFSRLSTTGSAIAASEKLRFFTSGGVSIGNTTDPGATNLSVTGTIQGGGKIFSAPGGYPISDLTGFGNNQGGYNDTTSKARLNLVGGVGDNSNRCGWTTYSIKTNGTGNGAEYYIRPVTWSGTAFAEQGSAGVYLQDNATSWSSASDERLKTELQPIEDATNKLATLRTVTGRYLADEEGTSRAFLIAQDVQQVLPQAVSENSEGYLGLAYTEMIPLLVAAIKELKQDLDAAKAEIQSLKV